MRCRWSHSAGYPLCAEYREQMRETISLAGRVVPEDRSPPLRDEFTELDRRRREGSDWATPDVTDGLSASTDR